MIKDDIFEHLDLKTLEFGGSGLPTDPDVEVQIPLGGITATSKRKGPKSTQARCGYPQIEAF